MCDFAFPDDFNDEQKKALLAASEFTFDIHWAVEKIRKGEYELWADVTNHKQLGLTTAENNFRTGLLLTSTLKSLATTLQPNTTVQ